MRRKNNSSMKKRIVAISEISLLVLMGFAVAFIFSEEVGVGSATDFTAPDVAPNLGHGGSGVPVPADTAAGAGKVVDVSKLPEGFTPDATSLTEQGFVDSSGKAIGGGAAKLPPEIGGGGGGGVASGGFWGIFQGTAFGTQSALTLGMSSILSGLVWGGIVYGGMLLIGNLLGLDEGLTKALALGGFAGTFVGTTTYFLGVNGAHILGAELAGNLVAWSPWLGIGIGAAVFIMTYKKEKKELIKFECLPWEPPYGGNSCDICNEDESLPCSEYRCKSLGQACELVNQGTTEEKCVWMHKNDVTAPKIVPSEEALTSGLRYVPDTAISPPNRGFKIINPENPNGCLDPFTKFKFGVDSDELSKCRIDLKRTGKFDDMNFPMGNSQLFRAMHVQEIPVPNPNEEGNIESEIYNNGGYSFYIRCVDANGNGQDSAEIVFSFCVNPGPDTSPPRVESTEINSGSCVKYQADEISMQVYTNEPSECKWSHQDKDYDAMENTMECAKESYQVNADLNYVCTGTLTAVVDRQDNLFYFRCKDRDGNIMHESYPLLLKGSESLVIDSVGPTGTIEGTTTTVMVNLTAQTSHGGEEGKAICGYSTNKDDLSSFIDMDTTGTHIHGQPIPLTAATYIYHFKCTDSCGNTVLANTTFTVKIDTSAPEITRVFRDGPKLKIITNEEAKCAYSTTNCNFNFEEGKPMSWEGGNKIIHYVDWSADVTYYIKCADMYNKQPAPDACQVIVKGSEF